MTSEIEPPPLLPRLDRTDTYLHSVALRDHERLLGVDHRIDDALRHEADERAKIDTFWRVLPLGLDLAQDVCGEGRVSSG